MDYSYSIHVWYWYAQLCCLAISSYKINYPGLREHTLDLIIYCIKNQDVKDYGVYLMQTDSITNLSM